VLSLDRTTLTPDRASRVRATYDMLLDMGARSRHGLCNFRFELEQAVELVILLIHRDATVSVLLRGCSSCSKVGGTLVVASASNVSS